MKGLTALLIAALFSVTGCAAPAPPPEGANIIAVVGAIHGQHRQSEQYSLAVLRQAITAFKPDIVLVELPPDRFDQASDNFKKYGEVRESRADDFPELTDVVFPLRKEMGFTIIPTAAWTQEIAYNRRATEERLKNDPTRAQDWAAYRQTLAAIPRSVKGRSDSPGYIHSAAYDDAVKTRRELYEQYFGADFGAGGWTAINAAHVAYINDALDHYSGQEKRILILYGAAHKYKILEALEARDDISNFDVKTLFSD